MTAVDLIPAATSTAPVSPPVPGYRDFAAVVAAWALAVLAAAVSPLEHAGVATVALFVHLMSMAVGFGSVVMIDVYGLLWLSGHRTLSDLTSLAKAAHGVIAIGTGGLLASGIALRPDITSPLARIKLLLVLILMLNGTAAQRMLHRLGQTLPGTVRGPNVPWSAFQRGLAAALISQATWWGAITIGFLTHAQRVN